MVRTIRARVKGGLLEPLEKLDLSENQEVTLTLLPTPSASDTDAFRNAAGEWSGTIDAEELIQHIYADRVLATRPLPPL